MAGEHNKLILENILEQMGQSRIPPFDYPTRIHREDEQTFLTELVPLTGNIISRKLGPRRLGRVAIALWSTSQFEVFQPRWLMPLQDEIDAVSHLLTARPEVKINYVETWINKKPLSLRGEYLTHGALVGEVTTELAEARERYWTAKAAELAGIDVKTLEGLTQDIEPGQ